MQRDDMQRVSAKITNLGFVCALFVVAAHIGWVADGWFGSVLVFAMKSSFIRACVPFYFVVSGFFLAARFDEEGWWRTAVRKRARTILLPYLFWLAFYALVMLVFTGKWVAGWSGLIGLNLSRPPMIAALWFLRCLMIFVLISPLLKACVRRWGAAWLVAAFLVHSVVSLLTDSGLWAFEQGWGGFFNYGFSVEGVFYFSLGLYLREHPIAWRSFRVPLGALVVAALLVALSIYLTCRHIPSVYHPRVLIPPLLMLGVWHFAPSSRWPRAVTSCAFPIYVGHGCVLDVLRTFGVGGGVGGAWLALTLGVAVPSVAALVLRRFAPRASGLVFGGR